MEFLEILGAAIVAASGAVGILEILHRVQTRQNQAKHQNEATVIFPALETPQQRARVVQMEDFIGGRTNGQATIRREAGSYGALISSTGQNRRSLAG